MPNLSRDGHDWTREEVVFALGLYFQIPWGKINQRNPVIIAAAEGGTASAVARLRPCAFACPPQCNRSVST